MSRTFPPNFPLQEFKDGSDRALSSAMIDKAWLFATTILQPMRDALGYAICIPRNGFVGGIHSANGGHYSGDAVDVVACDRSAAKLDAMYMWGRQHLQFGKLIHERDHLHITLPGFAGAYGLAFSEPTEGHYTIDAPAYTLDPIFVNVERGGVAYSFNATAAIAGLIAALLLLTQE